MTPPSKRATMKEKGKSEPAQKEAAAGPSITRSPPSKRGLEDQSPGALPAGLPGQVVAIPQRHHRVSVGSAHFGILGRKS